MEIDLEDMRTISAARNKLLEANVRELNEVYQILREKLKELREREKRIKVFEDELIRANKLSDLGELAESVAHEIKNPLITIQGFARRIGESRELEQIHDYARIILEDAGRLSDVLGKLLEFSRIAEPEKLLVDPGEVVDDTVLFVEHHLTRFKNIQLSVEKETPIPPVRVEKIHVQQSLLNLIMNAAQAMPGGGTIRIVTKRRNGYASISISDEGVGISENDLQRIFEPFFTTKDRYEGTGLGLSISKRLIEANDGRIEVTSKMGEGSTFTILLPLVIDNTDIRSPSII